MNIDLKFRVNKFFAYYISIIIISVVLSSIYIWQRGEIIKIGYNIQRFKRILKEQNRLNRSLTLEYAVYSSPKRIEKIARTQLFMKYPKEIVNCKRYILFSDSTKKQKCENKMLTKKPPKSINILEFYLEDK